MTYDELELLTYEELELMTYKQLQAITAVYDRTAQDVADKTAKGVLNATDITRVENNAKTVGDKIAIPITPKSWETGGLPRATADYLRLRTSVEAIRSGYGTFPNTPETPVQPLNSYQKWNDIEKILFDVNKLYDDTQKALYYSGDELYSGESVGIL